MGCSWYLVVFMGLQYNLPYCNLASKKYNLAYRITHQLLQLGIGDNYDEEERLLCGKIFVLLDHALTATFHRYINDKKSYGPKMFVLPQEALFRQEEEIMCENLDLNQEVFSFVIDSERDEEVAKTYLHQGDTMAEYKFEQVMRAPDCQNRSINALKIEINDYHYRIVARSIKAFRTELLSRVQKEGDPLTGYKILSSQVHLYEVLNELHLHQFDNYDDQKVKHYARYFFKKLCDKSREILSEKMIMDFENKGDSKQKHDKKQNKKNRKKKNKNKRKDVGNNGQAFGDQSARGPAVKLVATPTHADSSANNQEKTASKPQNMVVKISADVGNKSSPDKPNMTAAAAEEKSIKMEFKNSKLNDLIDEIKHAHETKSEHDKEDYIGLENIFNQKDSFDEYMETTYPDAPVQEENKKLNKISSKSLLSKNDQSKLKNTRTTCGSEFRSPSNEHKNECEVYHKISDNELPMLWSPKSLNTKFAKVANEIISLKSEKKPVIKAQNEHKMTNPTSDSCSIKCSSVTSDPDNRGHKENVSELQNKSSNYQNDEWITSSNKKSRGGKNKGANKAKQTKQKKNRNNVKQSKK